MTIKIKENELLNLYVITHCVWEGKCLSRFVFLDATESVAFKVIRVEINNLKAT